MVEHAAKALQGTGIGIASVATAFPSGRSSLQIKKLDTRMAIEAGATKREMAETIFQMSMFGGLPAMQKALEIAQSVYAEEDEE